MKDLKENTPDHREYKSPKGGGYTSVYLIVKTITIGLTIGTIIYGGLKFLDAAASRLTHLYIVTHLMMETVSPKPMFDPKPTY